MLEPLNILSLGLGVQSSVLALMAEEGLIKDKPVCGIFADVGDEPSAVYKWRDWLEKKLSFPIVTVSKGKLSEAATRVRQSQKSGLHYLKPGLPVFVKGADGKNGMMQRQCTLTFKIEVLRREAKRMAAKKQPINMLIGISTDEASRMKDSHDKRITNIYPLIDMGVSRKQCLEWMAKRNYPLPPRSACVYCPYHNDHEWNRIKTETPDEFQIAVEFEKTLQTATAKCERLTGVPFLHAARIPLSEIDFTKSNADPKMRTLNLFNNECEGMCGL